jgi:epoxyqueuosine reductase
MNDQSRVQYGRDRFSECKGIGLGGKVQRAIIIGAMQDELDSGPVSGQMDWTALRRSLDAWAAELGFQQLAVADCDLSAAEPRLMDWLQRGWHGDMDYMARHGLRRARPAELLPGTVRVIIVSINYRPPVARDSWSVIRDPLRAFVSRYATGRDYHKVLRSRLQKLADRLVAAAGPHAHRVFTDSAPVMEVALAEKAGLGWRGKHTLLLNREAGSHFFLGEIYTSLPLPVDAPQAEHCGRCTQCIDVCPTRAIVAPYQLDARRCISYLTIEHKGSIPEDFRPLIGNRVYGCDDCQLVCPWNRFAQTTGEADFAVRQGLDDVTLIELFSWDESVFRARLAGSAIARIGHERWLRNIAVGLGNATGSAGVLEALQSRADHPSALVREHVQWALVRHGTAE